MKLARSEQARANRTHGAHATRISALPNEDREAYAEIWDAAIDQFQPRIDLA